MNSTQKTSRGRYQVSSDVTDVGADATVLRPPPEISYNDVKDGMLELAIVLEPLRERGIATPHIGLFRYLPML